MRLSHKLSVREPNFSILKSNLPCHEKTALYLLTPPQHALTWQVHNICSCRRLTPLNLFACELKWINKGRSDHQIYAVLQFNIHISLYYFHIYTNTQWLFWRNGSVITSHNYCGCYYRCTMHVPTSVVVSLKHWSLDMSEELYAKLLCGYNYIPLFHFEPDMKLGHLNSDPILPMFHFKFLRIPVQSVSAKQM